MKTIEHINSEGGNIELDTDCIKDPDEVYLSSYDRSGILIDSETAYWLLSNLAILFPTEYKRLLGSDA